MSKRPRLSQTPSRSPAVFKPFKPPLKKAATSNEIGSPIQPAKFRKTQTSLQSPAASASSLQYQYSSLCNELKETRSLLNIANQAVELISQDGNSEADLQALIDQWRQASRDAAEVVFESAKQRFEGAGRGEKSNDDWKRRRRREREVESKWGDEGGDRENGSENGENEDEDEEEASSQPLTMSTMLRSLNIDPELIGWDGENEKWT